MIRRPHRSLWLWIAFVAFLATRVSDAHVHLCFDGQEPPTAVHMADGSVHNDAHHADSEHTDQDIGLFDALLVKKGDDSPDLDSFLPALGMLVVVSEDDRTQPLAAYRAPAIRPPFRLIPQPRGPPA